MKSRIRKNVISFVWCLTVITAFGCEAHGRLPCGTPPRRVSDRRVEDIRIEGSRRRYHRQRNLQTESYEELCDQCIEIDVHFHLVLAELRGGFGPFIPHPLNSTTFSEINETIIPELEDLEFSTQEDILELVEATMNVTNRSFRGTPFRFRWRPENTQTRINVGWNNYAFDYFFDISNALGSNDRRIMDVYLTWQVRSSDTEDSIDSLGAALPANLENEGLPYGIWMRYDVLAGGGLPRAGDGYTLTHEAGHVSTNSNPKKCKRMRVQYRMTTTTRYTFGTFLSHLLIHTMEIKVVGFVPYLPIRF